jgi:hypothetical protein
MMIPEETNNHASSYQTGDCQTESVAMIRSDERGGETSDHRVLLDWMAS